MSQDGRAGWMPDSPELWTMFLKHMPACVAVLDRNMVYLAVTDRWYEDLELVGRQVVGRSHYDVFPDLDEERHARHRRCLAGETLSLADDEYVLPSGSRPFGEMGIRAVARRGGRGGRHGHLLRGRHPPADAGGAGGGRGRPAEAGRDRHQVGRLEWDLNTNVVTWSDGLALMLGLSEQRAAGDRPSWTRLVHPDDRDAVMAQVERALKGEIPYDLEMRMLREDGIQIDVRVLGDITRDEAGRPLSVFGAMQDVTELRRKERELSVVHRRYRLASEASGTAAWEILPAERRMLADGNMARLIGRGGEAMSDDMDEWLAAFPPETRKQMERMLDDVLAGRRTATTSPSAPGCPTGAASG